MKLRKMFKNKLAFTLVELVVVIAIMAILAGAVAGAVVGIRASANKSEVTDTADKFATQIQMMIGNGDITSSWDRAKMKTELEKVLPGVTYETTDHYSSNTSLDAGKKYIFIPDKKSGGNYTTGEYTFKVYTNKNKMTVTVNMENGAVTKGSVE